MKSKTTNIAHVLKQSFSFYRTERNKRRNSALFNWIIELIEPISLMVVFYFLKGNGLIKIDDLQMPYFIYIAFGLIGYLVFGNTLLSAMTCLQRLSGFAKNFTILKDAILINELIKLSRQILISIVLISLILGYFQYWVNITDLVAVIAILIFLGIWGLTIGLLLSPFHLISTNTSVFANIAVRFGLFVSGVFFPFHLSGMAGKILDLNPVKHLLEAIRHLILGNGSIFFEASVITASLLPIALLILGRHFLSAGLTFIRQGS